MLSFELASQLLDPHSLKEKINELSSFKPEFISLTTHHPELPTLLKSLGPSPAPLMPHVCCVNNNKAKIKGSLQRYQDLGINKLLILQGDLKNSNELTDFQFASDLIEFIQQDFSNTFELAVAAYPENPNDFKFLQEKIKKGAKRIITQYSHDLNSIQTFQEQIKKLNIPTHIGLMPPPKDLQQLETLTQNHKITIPVWLKEAYQNNQVENAFHNFIQELQKQNANLHLFKVNSLDAAKISRLLNVRPRV